jgi:uncharacterized cupredoxin-like copper-binding protein
MLGFVLVTAGVAGLVGTSLAAVEGLPSGGISQAATFGAMATNSTCSAPRLGGHIVDVTLADMNGMNVATMMGGGHMMKVTANVSTVAAGEISFRAFDTGMMTHELLVLPLPPGGLGTRSVSTDGRVSEAGSLGEASKSCGEGAGDGIAPGAISWVTVRLSPGPYELICNQPGHYAMGMFTRIDVT